MVAPTPKSPRYQLAAHERQLCREELLSDRHGRRIRRAEQKDSNPGALQKKATRKKAAKLTAPAIEIPRSKKKSHQQARAGGGATAEAKETTRVQTTAEAKETRPANAATESKDTSTAREPAVAEVVADIVTSVVIAATPARPDAVARPATSFSTTKRKRRPARPRRRAVLQEDDEDGESLSYVSCCLYNESCWVK
ncbi:hypothetical protein PI125_g8224 [Phytophthora idaei]|nr:hypothetical protein PI125_g8224 [Phytophthora idaei]KAG3159686.1 hypothetical protein PI126_g7265 [Phytophthora idaei]